MGRDGDSVEPTSGIDAHANGRAERCAIGRDASELDANRSILIDHGDGLSDIHDRRRANGGRAQHFTGGNRPTSDPADLRACRIGSDRGPVPDDGRVDSASRCRSAGV